jgi:hypothetical protein
MRLLGTCEVTPIIKDKGELNRLMHLLDRLSQPLPVKPGAQHVVPGHHPFPGPLEAWDVNVLAERDHHLLDINAAVRAELALKQHPLLHWGERVTSAGAPWHRNTQRFLHRGIPLFSYFPSMADEVG